MPTEDGLIRVGDTVVLAFDRHADWPAMPSLLRVRRPRQRPGERTGQDDRLTR